MASADRALDLVVSYAHKDEALKQEFLVHLSPLRRQGIIRAWHDRDIDAGTEWKQEIDEQFNTADIIVLLVSPDFLNSDYCYDVEMKKALERHERGECRVIPVFLRACDWKGAPFGKLQGLPDDAIPVVSSQWPSRDDAFLRVVQGIRRVAEKLRSAPAITSQPVRRAVEITPIPDEQFAKTESIDDSGPGVLLNDKYFEADAVIEKERNEFEVRVAPSSAEEEADLRALRGDNGYQSIETSFAHGNDAFAAHIRNARTESTAGRRVWCVEIQRRDTHQYTYDFGTSDRATAEQVLAARARHILLGKKPSRNSAISAVDADFFVSGRREEPGKGAIVAGIWAQNSRDVVKFLRFARLALVFQLKTTRTCDDILELRLGPVHDQQLHVKFRGRRKHPWSDKTILVDVEGDCPLTRRSS
jgi:TIR domain